MLDQHHGEEAETKRTYFNSVLSTFLRCGNVVSAQVC